MVLRVVKGNGHGDTPASAPSPLPLQETPVSLPLVNGHDACDNIKVDGDRDDNFPDVELCQSTISQIKQAESPP